MLSALCKSRDVIIVRKPVLGLHCVNNERTHRGAVLGPHSERASSLISPITHSEEQLRGWCSGGPSHQEAARAGTV